MPEKTRILIVDDDKDICDTLADILEIKGYETVTVQDGFAALEIAGKESFHVALMDIRMPGMDGVETFKQFKKIAPGTPVIMITAFAVEELIKEALSEGAFAALHKPIDFDQLLSTIEASLGNGAFILVVDDDENLCGTIRENLEEKNYRVKIALDGESAVKKVRDNKFDIILLDLKLPAMNGFETYLAIRNIRPDVVAIVITGYMDEMNDLVDAAMEKGAYITLQKPVNMDQLFGIIKEVENKSGN